MVFFKFIQSQRDTIRALLMIAVLMGIAYQMIVWKSFAFHISSLQLKQVIIGLGVNDLKDYGAICNSLERWDCSEKVFEQLTRRFPGSQEGLVNYGIALGQREKYQRAANSLERYFKRGGNAYDAMLWYAHSLSQLLQPERALQWYYRSLSVSPGNNDVAIALVDHLVGMGRFEEALSVIASFTRGAPELNPFWNTKLAGIKKYIGNQEFTQQQELKTKVRLPAIVGKNHFIPIMAGTESGYQFFVVDQRQDEITMTEDVLANLMQSGSAKTHASLGEAIQRGKVMLERIQLGPWNLQQVEVTLCKSCQPRIGNAILHHVNMEIQQEDSTEFLLLSRR